MWRPYRRGPRLPRGRVGVEQSDMWWAPDLNPYSPNSWGPIFPRREGAVRRGLRVFGVGMADGCAGRSGYLTG